MEALRGASPLKQSLKGAARRKLPNPCHTAHKATFDYGTLFLLHRIEASASETWSIAFSPTASDALHLATAAGTRGGVVIWSIKPAEDETSMLVELTVPQVRAKRGVEEEVGEKRQRRKKDNENERKKERKEKEREEGC